MGEDKNVVSTPATPKPEDIATAFLNALEARTQRAERSVSKSFAEQYGMTEEEIGEILKKAKAEKAAAIPAETQQKITQKMEQINNRLIAAEIRSQGEKLGLIDADVAMALLDKSGIKIGDDDSVTGVEDALKALKESKAYLFKTQSTGETGVGAKIEPGSAAKMDGVEAAFRAKNPGLKF